MHTAQELRIIRSGLKPQPGAWARSVLRMEMAAGQWGLTPEAIAIEARHLIWQRYLNAKAREAIRLYTTPRRRADGWRVAEKQPPRSGAPFPLWDALVAMTTRKPA